ncbi:C-type lectin domain-containing protein, partial [Akkermansiaceae bacterium]|nr:C-type lectin domain-containing protein [Akkermansiaceae bacterium]
LKATNITGLNGGRVSFTPQEIAINLSGLTYDSKSELVISFAADSDGDGLDDSVETNTGIYVDENNTGTDPNDSDTDGDSISDLLEIRGGLDPLVPMIFDNVDNPVVTEIAQINVDSVWGTKFTAFTAVFAERDIFDVKKGATISAGEVYTKDINSGDLNCIIGGLDGQRSNCMVGGNGKVEISLAAATDIKGIVLTYDNNRPTSSFQLEALVNSQWIQACNVSLPDFPEVDRLISSQLIRFPEINSNRFRLTFGSGRLGAPRIWEVDAITAQGPTFQIVEGNFTWQEAKADAEAKGGRLAILESNIKIDAANKMLINSSNLERLWIGLEKNNQQEWVWLDGTSLESTEASGRTNGFNGRGNLGGGADKAQLLQSYLPDSIDDNNGLVRLEGYLLEILDQTPAAPFVAIDSLYESPTGESITLDATPTVGFPTEFTYQWCFNGFKIPANLGGTASSINIDNLQANEGTWSVSITNSEGIFEQDFEYRVYVDSDSDRLSDAFEELISETDINKEDTDDDGLSDAEEFNTYRTNPNSPDSDSDGFTDLYELETAYDPNSAESVPDALVNIMTAIEVKFNAALGATYAIEFSTDNQNWDVIEDDIVGEGGAVERLYSKQNFPTGFFRVERRDQ